MPNRAPALKRSCDLSAAVSPALSPFVERARLFERGADLKRIESNVRMIHERDRWSTFSKYAETAHCCREVFAALGLADVELESLPADGRTRFGDWTMPLAWDVSAAELHLIREGAPQSECLARYQTLPDALILQSAPTPPGGVRAELVCMETTRPEDWRGKVVVTDRHAQMVKARLARNGALGVISSHHPFPDEDRDSTYWYNTWSDQPGGWFAHEGDSRLWGFSLSPNSGKRLQACLMAGERLSVHAAIASRFFEGRMPFVSARLTGSRWPDEEILVCAHLYEHGAHDNASGAACVLETAALLRAAMAAGRVPASGRSIRFLLMPECFGTLAYASLRNSRVSRTRAGLNLDGVGAGLPVRVIREPPHTDAGLGSELAGRLKALWGLEQVCEDEFELSDNLLADPAIGVPMVWPHAPCARRTWHTSLDSLDAVDPEAIGRMAGAVAAWLLELSHRKEIETRRATPPAPPGGRSRHPGALLVPRRRGIGPLSLDRIPVSEWPVDLEQSPRWWTWQTRALWWADGRRSIGEIAGLVFQDPKELERVAVYFRFLEKWGRVELR